MAEGWLRHFFGDKVVIYSAGVKPEEVNPKAIKVMSEAGIDISSHTSDPVNKYLDRELDYIITVCDNAKEKCPYITGDSIKLHRNFSDPAEAVGSEEEIIDAYRKVRDMIGDYCREFVEEVFK